MKLRLLAAAAVVFGLSGCPEGAAPLPAQPPVVIDAGPAAVAAPKKGLSTVTRVNGTVTHLRAGASGPAAVGLALISNDRLETGAGSEAVLQFSDGKEIEVSEDARLTVREENGGVVLDVEKGLVLSRVAAVPPAGAPARPAPLGPSVELSILTPFGLTRVGGAEVAVDVKEKEARVEVKVGTVEFVAKNGEVTRAGAGEVATAKAAGVTRAPMVLPAVQVVVLAGNGTTEVRSQDGKTWSKVKANQALKVGDRVRAKAGKTTIAAEGSDSRYSLSQGSEATLVALGQDGNGESAELSLEKGELQATLRDDQQSQLKVGDVTLSADSGGQVTILKTAGGYKLNVISGDFQVKHKDGEAQAISAGTAEVSKKGLEVSEVQRQPLVLPTRQGLKVYHSGAGQVTLDWEGEEGRAWKVMVASDPSFSSPFVNGKMKRSFVNVNAPARGNLYWKVFDLKGAEVGKGSAFFGPEPSGHGELDRNRNEVKDGAEKTTIYFQDKPPSVTFVATVKPEAQGYKLQVYREGELNRPVQEKTGKEPRIALAEGVLGEGKYLWSATPLDARGAALAGSKLNKLEIHYDNAVPNLIIKSPKNGEPATATVRVVGIAPIGAKLWVNGKSLALDDKARFDGTTAPLNGRLIFRTVKGGAEVFTVRTLRRATK